MLAAAPPRHECEGASQMRPSNLAMQAAVCMWSDCNKRNMRIPQLNNSLKITCKAPPPLLRSLPSRIALNLQNMSRADQQNAISLVQHAWVTGCMNILML